MQRIAASTLFLVTATVLGTMAASAVQAADAPKDRIVAMYFHRTERCPTCQKMGSYSEEAVKTAFADEIKEGKVAFYYIDFQAAKNAKYVNAYGITGPTLIVAKISDNKVVSRRNLEDIWEHVRDKPAFLQYVQENVKAALGERTANSGRNPVISSSR
jgi:thiol-disulfide isomerase/thioredoxin